jgi:hypothetical protein
MLLARVHLGLAQALKLVYFSLFVAAGGFAEIRLPCALKQAWRRATSQKYIRSLACPYTWLNSEKAGAAALSM